MTWYDIWQFKTLLKVFCFGKKCFALAKNDLLWQKMFCFGKTLLKFICWACSRKTLLCFGIHLTIDISHLYHKYPTVIVMQIIVRLKMTSTHIGIGRPICHCRRHVGAAVTAAMAAALSPPLPPSPLPLPLPRLPPSPPPPAPFLLLLLPLFG